jgi:deoxyribodipyrimidine photolyase-related protein
MTVLVLGDQLTAEHGPLADRDPGHAGDAPDVLMIESEGFARRHAYHPHKLTLVFSAMRHFRDDLRERGYEVDYRRADSFDAGIGGHLEDHPGNELVAMRPPSHGAADRMRGLVADHGGTLEIRANELFLCSQASFEEWAAGKELPYRHENFYRFMRRETGYLMHDGEPMGGSWNYDDDNQQFPGSDYDPPEPPRYEPDGLTREVSEWVSETFDGSYDTTPKGGDWADPGEFVWPVTREDALDALERFCEERLEAFGPYQDAMLDGEAMMNHALLSPAINLGLLHPAEVVERVIDAAKADPDVPLNSLEGFVRQLIGWREFMRHVYREAMPDLADANQLDAGEPLPEAYWTGETDMACLSDVVEKVRANGYSHHIERLMVLSNFALIYGVEPAALNEWFHAAYVDAYHWVTTPNVVEMGMYGMGVFATKPYASSANYIDRMSDYCSGCPYYKTKTTGEGACPFNALFWDFLGRNEEQLRATGRMGLMYNHWDNKGDEERAAIRERAEQLRAMAERGEL